MKFEQDSKESFRLVLDNISKSYPLIKA